MAPIVQGLIRLTQHIKKPEVRKAVLKAIEQATHQPELAHFTIAVCKNPSHTSHTDPRPHATVRLATALQATRNRSQTAHIYYDAAGNYLGHTLYQERDDKSNDV